MIARPQIPAADQRSRFLLRRWEEANPQAVRAHLADRVRQASRDLPLRLLPHAECRGGGCAECMFEGMVVVVVEPN